MSPGPIRRPGPRGFTLATGASLVLLLMNTGAGLPVVRAAGAGLQVYFAADFKDAAYQKKVYEKVATSWKRPARNPHPGSKAVVIAVIQKSGAAPGPTLHLSSGSDDWDRAALEAVARASPFPPLPASWKRADVEVHFHFSFD